MESRGRRTPRMAAPADTPLPRTTPAALDPVRIDKPVAAPAAPPEVVVERISAPIPAASPPLSTSTALSGPVLAPTLPELSRSPALPAPPQPDAADIGTDILSAVARSRTALARAIEALSDELASFARHNLDTTAHTAIRMLGVKTWAEAVAVNTGFARASFDHWLDSTAKVSELGVKLAVNSSKPFLAELGKNWSGSRPIR